jgi:opacity protein-like surface antigen
MKPKALLLIVAAVGSASMAYAAVKKDWDGSYASATVHYLIYSNDLDEAKAPTPSDQRLSIAVTGDLAKQMFDAIGPDLKLGCGTTLGMRQRQRGDVDCSYDKEQSTSPYTCHFGFNLRKGKSIAGATC